MFRASPSRSGAELHGLHSPTSSLASCGSRTEGFAVTKSTIRRRQMLAGSSTSSATMVPWRRLLRGARPASLARGKRPHGQSQSTLGLDGHLQRGFRQWSNLQANLHLAGGPARGRGHLSAGCDHVAKSQLRLRPTTSGHDWVFLDVRKWRRSFRFALLHIRRPRKPNRRGARGLCVQ